jgi:DNA mismatch repair protein PMS2
VVTCLAQDAPKGSRLEFEVSGKLKGTSVVAAQRGTTVTVEHLFNNLPVRRRELERNIKREWGRVVGQLGQYACIQTGIKFSVTQQAGKGRKTSLFSTKGNQTTRENIVNVFGAKTLAALITLDLKLELEPTSTTSKISSTQDNHGKKDIRIIGHISRPASGDGRQTPDRQMFFVNSRPCGLPQVAKAFNEVYKSYNGSQSPFIFANIELDTHMYDVNVSPDKRTILLHDQNRMLDNLKDALIALFESQDYTVPVSQLPAQKQPLYKQLTISRDSPTPRKNTQPQTHKISSTPSEIAEDEESGDEPGRSRRDQSSEPESSVEAEEPKLKRGARSQGARSRAISRESTNQDRDSATPIFNWLGRKPKDQLQGPADILEASSQKPEGLARENVILFEKLTRKGRQESRDTPETLQSLESEGHSPPLFVPEVAETSSDPQQTRSSPSLEGSPEPPIPSLQSATRLPPSIADRISNNPRSCKGPAEVATITIGGHTVTSSIGTPYPKRVKTNNLFNIAQNKSPSGTIAAKFPSFGSALSQRFAATAPVDDDNVEEEADTEELATTSPEISSSTIYSGEDTHQSVRVKEEEVESGVSINIPSVDEEAREYINEADKRMLEEAKVQDMIKDAENSAAILSEENVLRTKVLFKGGSRKASTLNLVCRLETSPVAIEHHFQDLQTRLLSYKKEPAIKSEDDGVESSNAEERLSLTISKSDFAKMKIVGQFNLGFILASRTTNPNEKSKAEAAAGDDLFIIDQHASDEKYNFERLQATTIVQSQRLVHPKTLDLTAMEEEIVMENLAALNTNGFIVHVDNSGEAAVGRRCQLVALPMSRETAFNLSDLEELLALLAEVPGTVEIGDGSTGASKAVPRPTKVRKMFAMRACRSSIMIGKTLSERQMGTVVRHLGELDKPWNCPHGRPTMRHLCGLGVWDERGWREGSGFETEVDEAAERSRASEEDEKRPRGKGSTDWMAYVRANRGMQAAVIEKL